MQHGTLRRMTLTFALVFSLASISQADVVHTKDGRRLEGETRWTKAGLEIKLPHGTLTIPRKDVAKVEKQETPEQEYKRRSEALDPENAGSALKLAQFCLAHDTLVKHASPLLLRVVELSQAVVKAKPGGDGAASEARNGALRQQGSAESLLRRKLNYHLVEGAWVPPQDYYPARGFVKIGKRWVSKAEVAKRQASRDKREGARDADAARRKARRAGRELSSAEKNLLEAKAERHKALARVEHYERERDRIEGEHTTARAAWSSLTDRRTLAERLERKARSKYDRFRRSKCKCESECSCDWQQRKEDLEDDCDEARRETRRLRAEEKKAGRLLNELEVDRRTANKLLGKANKTLRPVENKYDTAELELRRALEASEQAKSDQEKAKGEAE